MAQCGNLRPCRHSELNSWNCSPQRGKVWPVCVCVYDEYVQIQSRKCIWSHLTKKGATNKIFHMKWMFLDDRWDWECFTVDWRLMAVCRLSLQSAMWSSVRQSGGIKLLNCTSMLIFNVQVMLLWCTFNHLITVGCSAFKNLSIDLFWYLSKFSP